MTQSAKVANRDMLFLPDFCEVRIVFVVIVIGELLAFLLVLTPSFSSAGSLWNDLAMISLFIQWVALSSLATLCVCRRWLELLGNISAGIVSYALVLLVTVLLSEAVYWLIHSRVLDVDLQSAARTGSETYWFDQTQREEIASAWHWEFLLRNLGISAIVSALAFRYFYVQFQWRSNLESEAQARIQALQSRIRPHFLFNSMNTIASFTRSQPSLAEQIVEDLADLFRVSLGDARVPITLQREFEVCREYLRIEQLRLGDRLQVSWSADNLPDDALLPALSLQPLLENAVYHGIEPAPEGGEVRVIGEQYGNNIAVTISNTVDSRHQSQRAGNHMALDNVRQRLLAFFGEAGELRVSEHDSDYNICVVFPYRQDAS